MSSPINLSLMKLARRAETQDQETLIRTFVDVGPLFTLLNSNDHQVVYGRRGTGKTHALKYLESSRANENELAIYVDLRRIGSNNSIYTDQSLSVEERGTRLLLDCCEHIYNKLFFSSIEIGCGESLLKDFDEFEEMITQVQVVGEYETEESESRTDSAISYSQMSTRIGFNGASGSASFGRKKGDSLASTTYVRQRGVQSTRVSFGGVGSALSKILEKMTVSRVWLLLDEWSTIPIDLQPLLADLMRRAFFPLQRFTVKIGAIEMRSNFYIPLSNGDYIGIELGGDAQADVNLDDFMVFGHDREKAETFFAELLRKHVSAVIGKNVDLSTSERFVSHTFTQRPAFSEMVRAAEGVPRDAINIMSLSAQKADDSKISINNIRAASKSWYDRDKASIVQGEMRDFLVWVLDEVIGKKKARGFLLQQEQYAVNFLIRRLLDARILHILKRGISAQDIPGVRFDVYGIDYGCYVELQTTIRAPQGLFQLEDEEQYIDVPEDDYRSLRRAILDINEFKSSMSKNEQ